MPEHVDDDRDPEDRFHGYFLQGRRAASAATRVSLRMVAQLRGSSCIWRRNALTNAMTS